MITNLDRVNSVVQIGDTAKFLQEISTLGANFSINKKLLITAVCGFHFFLIRDTMKESPYL